MDMRVNKVLWGSLVLSLFLAAASFQVDRPQVVSVHPENNSKAQPDTVIRVIFSKPMDLQSVRDAFSISPRVRGESRLRDNTFIFIPEPALSWGTIYEVIIGSAARDLDSNEMGSAYRWRFVIERRQELRPEPDTGKPRVRDARFLPLKIVSHQPGRNASNVPTDARIYVQFNQALEARSVNRNTLFLERLNGDPRSVNTEAIYLGHIGNTYIPPLLRARTATLIPDQSMDYDTRYSVTLTTGIRSSGGRQLSQNEMWNFTTEPGLIRVEPAENARRVPITISGIGGWFKVPLDPSTVNEGTVKLDALRQPGGRIRHNPRANSVIFVPDTMLWPRLAYTAVITTGVRTQDRRALLGSNKSWNFTTNTASQRDFPPLCVGELDGYVCEVALISRIVISSKAHNSDGIRVGSDLVDLSIESFRGFLTFKLPLLPAGTQATEAKVWVYRAGLSYEMTDILLIPVSFQILNNDTFDLGDNVEGARPLTPYDRTQSWFTADVTDLVRAELQRAEQIQFCLRLGDETELGRVAIFEDGENSLGSGNVPKLVLTLRQ